MLELLFKDIRFSKSGMRNIRSMIFAPLLLLVLLSLEVVPRRGLSCYKLSKNLFRMMYKIIILLCSCLYIFQMVLVASTNLLICHSLCLHIFITALRSLYVTKVYFYPPRKQSSSARIPARTS